MQSTTETKLTFVSKQPAACHYLFVVKINPSLQQKMLLPEIVK